MATSRSSTKAKKAAKTVAPAKATKAAKPAKATKAAKPAKAAKAKGKTAPAGKATKGKPAAPARGRKAPSKAPHSKGCPALDPFGGACQNTPRFGSRYCGVHSHLESR